MTQAVEELLPTASALLALLVDVLVIARPSDATGCCGVCARCCGCAAAGCCCGGAFAADEVARPAESLSKVGSQNDKSHKGLVS